MLEPPLPFGNAAARWYYVLYKELVARGHTVQAFAACAKPEEIPKAAALFPASHYDLKLYPFPHRSGLGAKLETLRRPNSYMFDPELKADFAAAAANCDIIHLEQLWCGWLNESHSRKAVINVHFLARIDLENVAPTGIVDRFQKWLRLSAETRMIRGHSRFITLSERLRECLLRVNSQAMVKVVPLGLDSSLYDYIPDERRIREPVIGLIGSMGWSPSYTAAVRLLGSLWPRIKERVPAARVQIVGWDARRMLGAFASLADVTIEENVPDTRPFFESSSVLLYAPGRGSGMKVKVLEALAWGVPVVTTSEGVEGLPAVDGAHAGIADDDAGLIERTVYLLNDFAAQNRQRRAGRELLETHCGPKPTVDAVEGIYETMLHDRSVRP
jgi:glycosyltransferase involved in cell wall biosynthesis